MLGINPADEYSLFDAPAVSVVRITSAPIALCGADPSRMVLMFSTDPVSPIAIMPAVPGAPIAHTTGLALTSSSPILILTQQQHGALAQCAWMGDSSTTVNVTVVTLSQRLPPEMFGYPQAYLPRQSAAPAVPVGRRTGVRPVVMGGRPALLPRALRDRLPGLLGEQ